jgi:hypothetical protein
MLWVVESTELRDEELENLLKGTLATWNTKVRRNRENRYPEGLSILWWL